MSVRFGLGLLAIIVLAVVVGVAAGKSQPPTAAAPLPAPTPTAAPAPPNGEIDVVANAGGNPEARYIGPNMRSTYVTRVGDKVTWVNTDTETHSVTADSGAFSSNALATNQKFVWRPRRPGTYPYGDYLHPDVRGIVVVRL